MRISKVDLSSKLGERSSRWTRVEARVGIAGVVLAVTGAPIGCGGSEDAIAPPSGRAEVHQDGQIVLTGCPGDDLIDTVETYELSTPTGSCPATATTCEVRTQQWCPGGLQGPALKWGCTCVQGSWSCEVTNRGTQYCPTLPNNPPAGDSQSCAYDPGRRQGIECTGDVPQCDVTTIQQCPVGTQGRTSRWSCACDTFPLLSPTVRVWNCERAPGESQTCAANTCPVVASYSVNTTRAALGERIELRAAVRDDDADDLTKRWSVSAGRIINPYTGNTGYTCTQPGMVKLTFVVSDGECEASMEVGIECAP